MTEVETLDGHPPSPGSSDHCAPAIWGYFLSPKNIGPDKPISLSSSQEGGVLWNIEASGPMSTGTLAPT
jgi:hypothetical protein